MQKGYFSGTIFLSGKISVYMSLVKKYMKMAHRKKNPELPE